MSDAEECTLCDLPTPDPPVTADGVAGAYCCRGCLEVARTLDDPAVADANAARDAVTDPGSVDVPESSETAYLQVSGMHCASCEAFLEARAVGDGVYAADANYAADAMRVRYDPDATHPGAIARAVQGVGYEAAPTDAADPLDAARDDSTVGRLLVGGFFGMMVMLWYVLFLYPTYFGLPSDALLFDVRGEAGRFLLANVWVLATVVLGYTGGPILRGAYVSLRTRQPNMDLLVALAATTAYLYSTLALAVGRVEVYFDVTVVVVVAVTVGGYYEDRVKRRALGALTDLTRERVSEARVVTADGTTTVPVADLSGEVDVEVRSGERLPLDGEVVEGTAAVDESLVTGEANPVRRTPGDPVRGGTLVAEGRVVVRADADDERTLDRVVSLLWDVRGTDGAPQRLADALATVFVPLVVALGVLAFVAHLALGATLTAAMLTGLAVLVVSCPCALGLATPLAVAAGTRTLFDEGVVLTDGSAIEAADDVDVVAVDKTGTLTTGDMELTDVVAADGVATNDLLSRAAAVEAHSDHPVADAVLDAARDGDHHPVTDFETHPGRGVSGRVDDYRVTVGGAALFTDAAVPADLRERYEAADDAGALAAYVGWNGEVRGVLVARDEFRPGWRAALGRLGEDRRLVVLTGDQGPATDRIAAADAVDDVYVGLTPEAKTEAVRRLRDDGTVLMVGDGSNDVPALAAADVGIAVSTGTELAADAADAVLVSRDLAAVDTALDVLSRTRRRIRENLAWAFCYNAIAVPAAVLGVVTPLLAAVAMASSSLLVVANSARSLRGDADASTTEHPSAGRADAVTAPVTTDGGNVRGGER